MDNYEERIKHYIYIYNIYNIYNIYVYIYIIYIYNIVFLGY